MPSLDGLRRAAARIGLPAWFVVIDVLWIAKLDVFGIDARHYQAAATEWLAGGDPWSVALTPGGITYASGPHTLLFYAPTSLLAPGVSEAFWMVLGLGAAVWLTLRLDVPLWWVLFPPLTHAIWNGNPQTIVVALLVFGGPVAAALAVGLKLYAAVPLAFRPRLLLVATVALVITLPLVPWQQYIADGFGVTNHLESAWNGSAWRVPILLPPTLLGLWILRRDGADWLSVPAIWPATQFYYVSMAFPLAVRRPLLAAALALPVPLMTPVAVMVLATVAVWRKRRAPLVAVPAVSGGELPPT